VYIQSQGKPAPAGDLNAYGYAPGEEGDRAGLLRHRLQPEEPRASGRQAFKRFIAEEDLVAVHSHMTREPSDRGFAVMDIFRLENYKVVEHWDLIQEMSEHATNPNGMF